MEVHCREYLARIPLKEKRKNPLVVTIVLTSEPDPGDPGYLEAYLLSAVVVS